ncbi:hypothetical protein PoB_006550200 [Plakobranchus ocellatus]|uniref:Uncharacterized protein n=1 Tax=Plakobranchus ocellatus TaxID=259542 RepID=A0AAV4D4D2_9GAST|nr:hypothetical protein PoB_006550200 [Plakobranchus ocellatus]
MSVVCGALIVLGADEAMGTSGVMKCGSLLTLGSAMFSVMFISESMFGIDSMNLLVERETEPARALPQPVTAWVDVCLARRPEYYDARDVERIVGIIAHHRLQLKCNLEG